MIQPYSIVVFIKLETGREFLIYIENHRVVESWEQNLINTFAENIARLIDSYRK